MSDTVVVGERALWSPVNVGKEKPCENEKTYGKIKLNKNHSATDPDANVFSNPSCVVSRTTRVPTIVEIGSNVAVQQPKPFGDDGGGERWWWWWW